MDIAARLMGTASPSPLPNPPPRGGRGLRRSGGEVGPSGLPHRLRRRADLAQPVGWVVSSHHSTGPALHMVGAENAPYDPAKALTLFINFWKLPIIQHLNPRCTRATSLNPTWPSLRPGSGSASRAGSAPPGRSSARSRRRPCPLEGGGELACLGHPLGMQAVGLADGDIVRVLDCRVEIRSVWPHRC